MIKKLIADLCADGELRKEFATHSLDVGKRYGVSEEKMQYLREGRYAKLGLDASDLDPLVDNAIKMPWPPAGQPTLAIKDVKPDVTPAGVEVEVTVTGTGFRDGDRLGFVGPDGQVEARNVQVVSSTEIKGTISLQRPGLYDVGVGRGQGRYGQDPRRFRVK